MSDTDSQAAAIRSGARATWISALYRWIVGVLFLLTAFSEFREHRSTVALGYLVFNQGIGAILVFIAFQDAQMRARLDAGERTTRHTVATALKFSLEGVGPHHYDFWPTVHQAVRDEIGEAPKSTPWRGAAMVLLGVLWAAFCDIIGIGIAWMITGS